MANERRLIWDGRACKVVSVPVTLDEGLRISINVTQDWEPGAEGLGNFIRNKAQKLLVLAGRVDEVTEETAMNDPGAIGARVWAGVLGMGDFVEVTGHY